MQQHFVEFLSPGTFVAESTTKPIEQFNDIHTAVAMAREIEERHNAVPYGFRFITRARADDELDSSEVGRSAMYYLGGRVLTLDGVRREMPNEKILISNMESNGWGRVVVSENSWRTVQPLGDNDCILDMAEYGGPLCADRAST